MDRMRLRTVIIVACALFIGAVFGVSSALTGERPLPVPFTEVSAEACGTCHGPDGQAPKVDMTQGECADCHAGSHGTGLTTIAEAPAHTPLTAPADGADLTGMVLIPAGPVIIGNDE